MSPWGGAGSLLCHLYDVASVTRFFRLVAGSSGSAYGFELVQAGYLRQSGTSRANPSMDEFVFGVGTVWSLRRLADPAFYFFFSPELSYMF